MNQREQALLTEIAAKSDEVKRIWDAAGDEPLPANVKQTVITLNKEIEEREYAVKEIREQAGMKAANEQRQRELERPVHRLGAGDVKAERADEQASKARPVGQIVLDDPQFKSWRDSIMVGGAVTSAKFGHSPRVSIPGGAKTLITGASATSGGAMVYPQFLGLQDNGTFMRPLTVRDIITNGTTGSDLVEYVRITGYTNNAAPVAEATATSGGTGAKPESAATMAVVSEAVKTIAHWIPATRRALSDAGQLRTLIESFLRYGLEEELEDQILTGDGTGENFTGILNVTGTSTQAYDTSLLVTTRRARTKVRTLGRAAPTAYVMHPNDWEDLDLTQDAENRYYFGGPSIIGNPRLWGLPVVESEGMTEGVSVVADWRLAVLWDREAANVLMSDSHSDFFVRNLIAVLAEMRAAFGVLRPAAFVEIDLTA
jgi:HK97 family phage major capsid protein